MEEREQAAEIADRLLDEPYADPDDDVRVLCRQFERSQERIQKLTRERDECAVFISDEMTKAGEDALYGFNGEFAPSVYVSDVVRSVFLAMINARRA